MSTQAQYIFYLICCFQKGCIHPICESGPHDILTWYPGGLSLFHLPLPVPDPARNQGREDCSSCGKFCSGHYKTEFIDTRTLSSEVSPPLTLLKKLFSQNVSCTDEDSVVTIARNTLLPVSDVNLWLDHLRTVSENRKRGAAKRTKRHKSKKEAKVYCGKCHKSYEDKTEGEEFWIA